MDFDALMIRHEAAFDNIAKVQPQFKRELYKLDETANRYKREVSTELIACRRSPRTDGNNSLKYHELVANFEESIKIMEQWLTMATLLT